MRRARQGGAPARAHPPWARRRHHPRLSPRRHRTPPSPPPPRPRRPSLAGARCGTADGGGFFFPFARILFFFQGVFAGAAGSHTACAAARGPASRWAWPPPPPLFPSSLPPLLPRACRPLPWPPRAGARPGLRGVCCGAGARQRRRYFLGARARGAPAGTWLGGWRRLRARARTPRSAGEKHQAPRTVAGVKGVARRSSAACAARCSAPHPR